MKSENIIYSKGKYKISDFGMSIKYEEKKTTFIKGCTLNYASPELYMYMKKEISIISYFYKKYL